MTRSRRSICFQKSFVIVFLLIIVFSCPFLRAQPKDKTTQGAQRLKWYEAHTAMKEQSMFKNLAWQFLGPTNVSGRMTDVAVVTPKGKQYTIYVAGASGGVWKTTNEGITWEPVFEHAASTSIGDVTIAPSDQDIVWIGGGEANIFRSSMAGSGVYKSTDAGKTWKHMGLADTHTIPRIVIHPKNPDIVYVAASGHEWTNNEGRGVYKTTDGGRTWEKVFYVDEKTGAIDLAMDPSDSQTLYAATWQRIRKRWNDPRNEADYTGSGIFKTTDGGKTWLPIDDGLPEPRYRGRIGIDICLSKPNVLYAFIDNYEIVGGREEGETDSYGRPMGGRIKGATVFRTDDGGRGWRQVSESNDYMTGLSATYGWVFGQIRVDPNDENRIYVMGLQLNVSEDGGKTFRPLRGMHVDHHGLWIDPENSDYLVNVNDGGLAVSYDGGENWRMFTDNLPLAQFFNVMVDMDEPFHVYGSMQDHGSFRGIVDLSRGRNKIPAVAFEGAPGGEGSSHAIDPTNPNIVYSAGFYGSISRTDLSTGDRKDVLPKVAEGEPKLRGQWVAPFIISPHNPRIIYHGMQYLYRSMDRGDSWERLTPDLTTNDPKKMGDIPYQTIFAVSESPFKFGVVYAGTDDGRAHVTRDGGLTWKEITKGLAKDRWVSRIAASAFDEGAVYLSQNGKRNDDFTAYLWKSTDYGKTWVDITGNIPCGPINVVREDPKNENVLYVGTDLGAYVSVDGGDTWHVLSNAFPTTFVHDMVIHPRDDILVAATHGRGMWALDVRQLYKFTGDVLVKQAHIFDILPAKLPQRRRWGWIGGEEASIHYYLKKAQKVVLVVKDESGRVVREMDATGDAGYNVAIWDLKKREKPKTERESPYVESGTYTVELTAGSFSAEAKVDVRK